MKAMLAALAALLLFQPMSNAQSKGATPSLEHVQAYITPYYNSTGPLINVGPYSAGLASTNETQFVDTIRKMQSKRIELTFAELYVAATRLYDWGYRKESVYWFYCAQYQGRLFQALLDDNRPGNLGDPGFELSSANGAFMQLVGPYINAFAFGDPKHLASVLERVKKEGQTIPDLAHLYPKVNFKPKTEWPQQNKIVGDGLASFITMLESQKDDIKATRAKSGVDAKVSKLSNKDFPTKK